MPMKNPADVAKKWSRNLTGAVGDMKKSIDAIQVSPMEQAAQAGDRYIAGVNAAFQSGKWQQGLRSVSLQDWKTKTGGMGLQRVAAGAQAAESKMQSFMSQFLPFAQGVSDQIKSMPKATEQERIQRMLTNVQLMKQFRKS